MAPWATQRGSISLGLARVPAHMTTGTESKELRFHFLHKDDLAPIGYGKGQAESKRAAAR